MSASFRGGRTRQVNEIFLHKRREFRCNVIADTPISHPITGVSLRAIRTRNSSGPPGQNRPAPPQSLQAGGSRRIPKNRREVVGISGLPLANYFALRLQDPIGILARILELVAHRNP
jgi:hypothetical protein